jgi:hypothetical protein
MAEDVVRVLNNAKLAPEPSAKVSGASSGLADPSSKMQHCRASAALLQRQPATCAAALLSAPGSAAALIVDA